MPAEGRVGAGTGATVGKWLGPAHASHGGFGCFAHTWAAWTVFGAAVVNALGDVIGFDGHVIAGARNDDGAFVGPTALRSGDLPAHSGSWRGATNTTLAVVATDAPLSRTQLEILARMTSAALARRISPVFTPFDGDIVFAIGTASADSGIEPRELLMLGAAGAYAVEEAIVRGIRFAVSAVGS
jgi:L-aminopeptidase/D-esterase-like protein